MAIIFWGSSATALVMFGAVSASVAVAVNGPHLVDFPSRASYPNGHFEDIEREWPIPMHNWPCATSRRTMTLAVFGSTTKAYNNSHRAADGGLSSYIQYVSGHGWPCHVIEKRMVREDLRAVDMGTRFRYSCVVPLVLISFAVGLFVVGVCILVHDVRRSRQGVSAC